MDTDSAQEFMYLTREKLAILEVELAWLQLRVQHFTFMKELEKNRMSIPFHMYDNFADYHLPEGHSLNSTELARNHLIDEIEIQKKKIDTLLKLKNRIET